MELKHGAPHEPWGYLRGAAHAWAATLLPYADLEPEEQDAKPEVRVARERWDGILAAIESYEKGEGY
jgi:hypothetical protein